MPLPQACRLAEGLSRLKPNQFGPLLEGSARPAQGLSKILARPSKAFASIPGQICLESLLRFCLGKDSRVLEGRLFGRPG